MFNSFIPAIEYFIRLSDAERDFIASIVVRKEYKKDDYFLREGQVCREVGFIEEGLVRYYNTRESGEEFTVHFGKENDFVSNYQSFLDHSPSRRNIQCIEPSVILTISYTNLQRLYEEVKEGEKFGRLACEQLYLLALKQVDSFYENDPEQRYLRFVNDYPDLQQRIQQYYISSYVGVKPPSLSRIRKRLSL